MKNGMKYLAALGVALSCASAHAIRAGTAGASSATVHHSRNSGLDMLMLIVFVVIALCVVANIKK